MPYLLIGKDFPRCLPVQHEGTVVRMLAVWPNWGHFWGSIRDSGPAPLCKRCSVAPVSVVCVRRVLS